MFCFFCTCSYSWSFFTYFFLAITTSFFTSFGNISFSNIYFCTLINFCTTLLESLHYQTHQRPLDCSYASNSSACFFIKLARSRLFDRLLAREVREPFFAGEAKCFPTSRFGSLLLSASGKWREHTRQLAHTSSGDLETHQARNSLICWYCGNLNRSQHGITFFAMPHTTLNVQVLLLSIIPDDASWRVCCAPFP